MNYYYLLLAIQYLVIGFFVLFAFHRYFILFLYLKSRKKRVYSWPEGKELPVITVQVPVFNEYNVAKRIIDAVSVFDYPHDKLDIQILDDSTDETVSIVAEAVAEWKQKGVPITHLHRTNRQGFKAGALDAGMKTAKGEFIAIFDADFVPTPDLLHKLVAPFADDKIGMTQARWGHMNRGFSTLTEVQAMLLDSHFVLEQSARNRTGRFMNFNGTAGMWRKEAIVSSGGWQHDTLTEDMDLSYRAQLEGWKFIYLPDVVCPAELPINMNAFKTQQHRWCKGAVETGKKLHKKIWDSDQPLKVKAEAMLHLFANLCYPMNIFIALAWLPSILIGLKYNIIINYWIGVVLFLIATFPFIIFYLYAQQEVSGGWWKKIQFVPALLAIGTGLTINSGIAVLEALFDKKSEFTRTPKYGVIATGESWKKRKYGAVKSKTLFFELFFALYLAITLLVAMRLGFWGTVPFIALFFISFVFISSQSIRDSVKA